MPLWFIAFVVYAAGIPLLVAVWRAETARIGAPVPIATVFLAVQHHVFALGGFLLALTAGDAMFATGLGWFPVTFGSERLLWMELLSIFAALVGVLFVTQVRGILALPGRRKAVVPDPGRSTVGKGYHSALAVSLPVLSTLTVLTGWLFNAYLYNEWALYWLEVSSRLLLGSFLTAGVWWRELSVRQRFIVWGLLFLLLTFGLAQGSRSLWFWPGALLLSGYFLSAGHTWRSRARTLTIGVALAGLLAVAGGRIVPIRTDLLAGRVSIGPTEMLERVPLVLRYMWSGDGITRGIAEDLRLFGERLVEETARMVMGEELPAVGWPEGAWRDFLVGFLPQKLLPFQSPNVREPYFLRDYGYNIWPGEYVGLGYALFADAWRHFRALGVAGVYFVLGVALGALSWWSASYREEWQRTVFGALVGYGVARSYTSTVMAFWPSVVHTVVVTLVWVWLIRILLMPQRIRRPRVLRSRPWLAPVGRGQDGACI